MASDIERKEREDRAARLRWARREAGYRGPQAVVDRFGFNINNYKAHEAGRNGFSPEIAADYAKAFGVSRKWLYLNEGGPQDSDDEGPRTVPIAGKAGAGPFGSVLFATSDGDLGEADAPLNATASTRGLEVEGESMRGVAENGSLIFYEGREPPNETHVGELCICWLEDERVLVKYPYHSSGPGLWNLESTTATTLRDVPVRFFAHVINIVPRRAAKSLIRKNVTVTPIDTVISK